MIFLATGTLAGSRRLLAQARDAVTTFDRPAAYIDAAAGWQTDPVAHTRIQLRPAIRHAEAMIARLWADGVRTIVVAMPDVPPEQRAGQLSEAAFWFRREASQPVVHLNADESMRHQHGGTWTAESLESVLRSRIKTVAEGPRIEPAEPAAPRYETDRLVLTWPTPQQIEGYYRAIVGTDIFDTIIWNGPSNPNDLHNYWLTCRQDFARGPEHQLSLAAIDKATGQIAGGLSLRPHSVPFGVWDLGYALAKPYHGRGLATEAARVLVDVAFRERHAYRVFANAFVGNQASRRVLEKLGFTFEGTSRGFIEKPSGRKDEWLLAITRPDWESGAGRR